MHQKIFTAFCLFVGLAHVGHGLSVTGYLEDSDIERIKGTLLGYLPSKDLASLYGVTTGLEKLSTPLGDHSKDACSLLSVELQKAVKGEDLFYLGKTARFLPACGVKADSRIEQVLSSSIQHVTSLADLYYIVEALDAFNLSVPVEKVQPALDRLLKQDDSVQSLGYAFHVAAKFPGNVDQYFDRIEDVVVQADMVDNKFYQFEGGLSVTALVISGIFELSEKLNRKPELNAEQVVGFAEYLVSRKTVRPPKSLAALLTALDHLTTNPFFVPVVISLSSTPVISSEQQSLKIRICDLLGNELQVSKAVARNVVALADKTQVKSNLQLESSGKHFTLALSADDLPAGFYSAEISADVGSDSRLIGAEGSTVNFKVVKAIAVNDVEVGTGEVDQSTAPKLQGVSAGAKLGSVLEVDAHQRLIVKFRVQEKGTQESFDVHQAFVRLSNEAEGKEVFLIADRDSRDNYKVELDLKSKGKDFGGVSGSYVVELIVGDALAANAVRWNVATVKITVDPVPSKASDNEVFYQPRKEIQHMFRLPEKRPPAVVSNLFSAVVVGLFVVFLLVIARLTGNSLHFPVPLWSFGFSLCLVAIVGLYTLFWLKLNMFETLKYLSILGGATFLVGHKLLSDPSMSQS